MPNDTIFCHDVPDDSFELGQDQPAKYRACPPLPLRRFWEGPEALPAEAGVAFVGAAREGLAFYVLFHDSDIFSTATADNQRMWTLGDVAEVFMKPGRDRKDYWEIHVTPNDFIMDIHIPDRSRFMAGEVTWEQVIAPSSGTMHRVRVFENRWAAELVIPWHALGAEGRPDKGTTWQFAVCRYNYNGGLSDPELSSTAALTEPAYQRYEEYTDLLF